MTKKEKDIIEQLIWLRIAQLLVNERYKSGDFLIPIHLALGHESLAIAVKSSMEKDDCLFLTHRNIHYNLARVSTLRKVIDEYYLKDSGLANGNLGSMNLSNPAKNIAYSSSILGNNLPVATGYALGKKASNMNEVVFVVTGDGAIEEGSFWESLVFSKSNALKIIFIIENNQWSLATRIEERRSKIKLESLADSLGIGYCQLNGNDPFEYIKIIRENRVKTIKNKTPMILEVQLTTLGYWHKKTTEYPKGKLINYHAGPAPTIELEDYPIICNSNEDPLHLIKKYMNEKDLINISKNMLEKLVAELK
jgi:TPP-dependent pyruvate/acetoin dehydrogenase alpha subunit